MLSTNEPLVSVLIPLYNHERFIERCLESVLEDGYSNIELIVIDDGSSDQSAQVAREWYKRRYEKIGCRFEFHSRENRGVSATLNELFEHSQGEYIAYIASDDYLLPGSIKARLNYLQAHPEKLLVIADYQVVDADGLTIYRSGVEELYQGRKKYLVDERTIAYELVFHWCISGAVYLGRRELYKMYPYDERLVVEDWDFCLRLASKKLIGFLDYVACAYRVNDKALLRNLARDVRITQSFLLTVQKHTREFSGLLKIFFWAETLRYRGYLARLTGKNRFYGAVQRKFGRFLRRATIKLYDRLAPGMIGGQR